MAITTSPDTIVVMDDELYQLQWLVEYIDSLGFKFIFASNANEAIELVRQEIFRALILDLNVPLLDPLADAASAYGDVYRKYPGLFVARTARNLGYRDRQVVIYSVHRDQAVADEAQKIGCTYILKGRPVEMKHELSSVLAYDPTQKT